MTGTVLPVTSPAPREDTAYSYDELRATTPEIGVDLPAFRAPNTVLKSFLIIICMFGFIANSAMLVSLLMKRRGAAGKTVNVFVCNQTILELVATFVLVVKQSLTMSGYLDRNAGVLRQLDLVVVFILVPRQSLMMPGYLAWKAGVLRQLVVAFILVLRQSLMMPRYL